MLGETVSAGVPEFHQGQSQCVRHGRGRQAVAGLTHASDLLQSARDQYLGSATLQQIIEAQLDPMLMQLRKTHLDFDHVERMQFGEVLATHIKSDQPQIAAQFVETSAA